MFSTEQYSKMAWRMLVSYIGRSCARARRASSALSLAGLVVRPLPDLVPEDPLLRNSEVVLLDAGAEASPEEAGAAWRTGRATGMPPLIILDATRPSEHLDALAELGAAWGSLEEPDGARALPSLARAVIRRHHGHAHDIIRLGALAVDLRRFRAYLHVTLLPLIRNEYGVLAMLALRSGQPVTRERLVHSALAANPAPSMSLLKTTIHGLRKKLHHGGGGGVEILTLQRKGYTLLSTTTETGKAR